MNSMLVVSDRATAAAVVEHFRQHRIGTVNCKILSELQQQRASTHPAAAAAAAGSTVSTPVLELLQYDGQSVPGLQQLMEQLLGGWMLVDSREVALRLLHLKRSMVTRWAASKQHSAWVCSCRIYCSYWYCPDSQKVCSHMVSAVTSSCN
jgi:chromosome segregation ATPase